MYRTQGTPVRVASSLIFPGPRVRLQLLVCACALGAGGMQGLGTVKDDVLLGVEEQGAEQQLGSEDFRSQLESALFPDSQSGSGGSG